MKSLRFVLTMCWREGRAAPRRLALVMAAVAGGVAAMVAINSFADKLQESVRGQAREILGADLALTSGTPFSARAEALASDLEREAGAVARARVISFVAMVYAPHGAESRLVQVEGYESGFPFYGKIETDPADAFAKLGEGGAVVDPALLTQLGARVGDVLALGKSRLTIRGTIVRVPGDVSARVAMGPRVFIDFGAVKETGLVIFGSRGRHELFFKLKPGGADPQRVAERFQARLQIERVNISTVAERERSMSESLGRLGRYLGLTGLLALLLGGLGVASAVNAFLKGKLTTVAVLRCLGASAAQTFAIYLTLAAIVGLLGSLVGAFLGILIQLILPRALSGFLPADVHFGLSPRAVISGIGLGVWVSLAFSLLPLLSVRLVPPLAALRQAYETARPPRDRARWLAMAALGLSALGAALVQSGSVRGAFFFTATLSAALAVLFLAATGLTRAVRRFTPAGLPYVWRQGLANLHRPANQTRTVVLALGFGAFLQGTVLVVQQNLLRDLDSGGASADRPNLAFIDVQTDQRAGIEALARARGAEVRSTIPIVPMRILSVKGKPVAELLTAPGTAEEIRGRWALRRQFMTTYRDTLKASERVVEGAFWKPGSYDNATTEDAVPVSIGATLVRELNVRIGDEIEWDVQGVSLLSRVSNVREVEWARFEPNFLVLFPEGPLARAPQMFAILARLEDAHTRAQIPREVSAAFPNVSALDLTQVLTAAEELVTRMVAAIRFMGLFSLAAGAIVLIGAVSAERRQRVREGVLLKTLGATRAQVLRILTAEYTALGVLSSLAALGLSTAIGWGLVRFAFEARFTVPLGRLLALASAVVAGTVGVGLMGSREVFRHPALEVLREE